MYGKYIAKIIIIFYDLFTNLGISIVLDKQF